MLMKTQSVRLTVAVHRFSKSVTLCNIYRADDRWKKIAMIPENMYLIRICNKFGLDTNNTRIFAENTTA